MTDLDDDTGGPSSLSPTAGDDGAKIPAPGDSASIKPPMQKRERARVILALLLLGYLTVVIVDKLWGIPGRP